MPTGWPSLLRGAVLLEAWTTIDPLPRHSDMGVVLVNAVLKRAGRFGIIGFMSKPVGASWSATCAGPSSQSGLRRTVWQLRAVAAAETIGLGEYDRLSLARQVVARRLVGRRSSSHLGEVIEVLTETPIVTAEMIADRCKVSQQAARGLITQLGAGVVEVSGRARYRSVAAVAAGPVSWGVHVRRVDLVQGRLAWRFR